MNTYMYSSKTHQATAYGEKCNPSHGPTKHRKGYFSVEKDLVRRKGLKKDYRIPKRTFISA